jgi:EAL domain-containing protein (putative c-di-GMP-specific phosphodiesterase class I)
MTATVLDGLTLTTVLANRAVHMVFQPIFDLTSGQVVGLEALARGPVGSTLETPGALFGAARVAGRTAELDWICRAAAFRALMEATVPPSMSLFVNTEPESLGAECPADLAPVVRRAESLLRVFVEVNDRALATDPAGLLAAADRAREMGWGIAVDDVGSSRAPIAMLPVLHADVVKLDVHLLRSAELADASAVVMAALRHVEQTGASLCVERIEDEDDLRWARSMGAVYGQGRFLGEPGPLAEHYPPPRVAVPLVAPSVGDAVLASPFELMVGAETRLVDLAHYDELERWAAFGYIAPGAAPVVLVGLGRRGFEPERAASFPQGTQPLLLLVFSAATLDTSWPGVRGARLPLTDPLADERFLVVMNEKGGIAVHGHAAEDGVVEVQLSQDPAVVHGIARHLIRRLPAPDGDGYALPPPGDPEPEVLAEVDGTGRSGRWLGRRR